MFSKPSLIGALAVCWLVPCGALAQESWGPLTVRSMAPLFPNRLSYMPGRLIPLAPGRGEVQLAVSHVNIWAQMPGYFFDGEWTRLALRGGWGLQGGWELNVDVPLLHRMGGFMDGFIMGFHRLLHVTQARRDRYPRDRLRVDTVDGIGVHPQLSDGDAGWGLGNPSLGVKKRLTDNLVAEAFLKLPWGSLAAQFATPMVALAMDVALTQPLGAGIAVDVVTGLLMSPGDQRVYGIQLALLQKFFLVALQWRAWRGLVVVLQYLNQDGIAETCAVAPLNQTTHEFALGVKIAPWTDERLMLEMGIIENSVHDANTPDFGLHAATRWLF